MVAVKQKDLIIGNKYKDSLAIAKHAVEPIITAKVMDELVVEKADTDVLTGTKKKDAVGIVDSATIDINN